jgi:hypothetical protein
MIRRIAMPQLVAAGSAGTAVGTAVSTEPVRGRLVAAYLNYSGTATTTDVTLLTRASPAMTLLSVANNITDGWYFPMAASHLASSGAALTYDGTHPVVTQQVVCDYVEARLAQGDDEDTLDVTLLLEE